MKLRGCLGYGVGESIQIKEKQNFPADYYEIGYRFPRGPGDYSTPYYDLPPVQNQTAARLVLRQLRKDFPRAEWRIVACFTEERRAR